MRLGIDRAGWVIPEERAQEGRQHHRLDYSTQRAGLRIAAHRLGVEAVTTRAEPNDRLRARCRYVSFFTSARILSGSGSSPLPYFSTKATLPVLSTTNVARLFAFQSAQYTP